jgi:hypothetical protein
MNIEFRNYVITSFHYLPKIPENFIQENAISMMSWYKETLGKLVEVIVFTSHECKNIGSVRY